mmetsp:Transcript_36422/g.74767  ORF Transcript_36422/g.74767 Transcript_36422/m.74767 type:complete len:204 (+) Transcript_36422:363-974(+)
MHQIVRLIPRHAGVPVLLLAAVRQNIVVPCRNGLLLVVHLPSVGPDRPVWGDCLPLVDVGLVRRFHLPRLDQILHNLLERTLRMVLRLSLQVEEVGKRVVRRGAEAPFDVRIVHEGSDGLAESLLNNLLEFFLRGRKLLDRKRAVAASRHRALHVGLCHAWSFLDFAVGGFVLSLRPGPLHHHCHGPRRGEPQPWSLGPSHRI